MSRTSDLSDAFRAGVGAVWLNAVGIDVKHNIATARVSPSFTGPAPGPCASLLWLPYEGPWLRGPSPELDEYGHHLALIVQRSATPLSLRPIFPDRAASLPKPCNQAQNPD